MAFTEVGSGSQRNKASVGGTDIGLTCAFPANVVSGNLLVVGGTTYGSGVTEPAITDTVGTIYTKYYHVSSAHSTDSFYLAWGVAPSSGANTVTVVPTGSGLYMAFAIDEFSGQHASPVDVDGTQTEHIDVNVATDTITTVTTDGLVLGVMGWNEFENRTIDPTGGTGTFTTIGEEEDGSNFVSMSFVFQKDTTIQTYTVRWAMSDTATLDCVAKTIALKPATGAAAVIGKGLTHSKLLSRLSLVP